MSKSSARDTPSRRKVVVGGTHQDFREWQRASGLSMRDVIRATSREQIMGLELKPDDIVRLGPITTSMEEELRMRIR